MSKINSFFKRKSATVNSEDTDIFISKRQKLNVEECKVVKIVPEKMEVEVPVKSIYESKENLVDKYKPKSSNDLIGNKTSIDSLKRWLISWNDVHIHKKTKIKYSKQNPGAKCALLSGPPGIGKTTAAHLISKDLGFEVFEFNASDARSKRLIEEKISDVLNNSTIRLQSLSLGKKDKPNRVGTKKVIIMDEVDGMSSEDRGGMQQLIKLLKTTKVPIICICNDRVKASVRSLANHSYDLRFQRPNKISVKKWLTNICLKEKIDLLQETLETLIGSSSGDIRQLLNSLSFIQLTGNSEKQKEFTNVVKKDSVLTIDHSTATQFLFNESQNDDKMRLRFDAFFVSYDLIPLLIADHFPSAVRNFYKMKTVSSNQGALDTLEALSKAADAVAISDVYSREIMQKQRWSLLPVQASMNVSAAKYSKGKIGFAGFPQWLGKFSSQKKKKRLLQGLELHLRQFANGANTKTVRLDMLRVLKLLAVQPMLLKGKEGIEVALENMNECGISRDDAVDTFQELKLERISEPMFESIDSKTKREFTRRYNKYSQKSQLLSREAEVKEKWIKKKK